MKYTSVGEARHKQVTGRHILAEAHADDLQRLFAELPGYHDTIVDRFGNVLYCTGADDMVIRLTVEVVEEF
jgi:hypothetical protein